MGMSVRLLTVVAVVIAAGVHAQVHAQSDPPAAAGAWTLSVVESGGFAGGVSTVTVTSEGQVTCSHATCDTPVPPARLTTIAAAIAAIKSEEWGPQKREGVFGTGTCADCGRTTITLKRREAEGMRTYEAAWDGLQKVSSSLRELERLILDLRSKSAR
jgi:hypothetical protein